MVRTKNTRRCILCLKTCSCFYCLGERFFFLRLSGLSSGSALFMVASLTMGIHPAAINDDVVPSFTTIYWFIVVQAARLVHKHYYELCKDIMISKTTTTIVKGVYDWKPYNDRKTRSDLVQWMKDLRDVKDKHDFCEETSCSWSEWLDLWIVQLKNVHGPIVKEDV